MYILIFRCGRPTCAAMAGDSVIRAAKSHTERTTWRGEAKKYIYFYIYMIFYMFIVYYISMNSIYSVCSNYMIYTIYMRGITIDV